MSETEKDSEYCVCCHEEVNPVQKDERSSWGRVLCRRCQGEGEGMPDEWDPQLRLRMPAKGKASPILVLADPLEDEFPLDAASLILDVVEGCNSKDSLKFIRDSLYAMFIEPLDVDLSEMD